MEKKHKRFFSHLKEVLTRPDMSILPGQLAFFFILSLVPTITIIFYIATFLSISLNDIVEFFNLTISPELMQLLTPYVENTDFGIGLFILMVVGIYLASNGTNSIIVTADSIYGIEQKTFLERRIKAIIMIFVIILLFLFIVLVPIFGNFIMGALAKVMGTSGVYAVINFLKLPFSWFTIFVFIKLLYTLAPDKQIPSAYVNGGAIFASIGWVIATEVYLYYVGHFANYSLYYSGLTNLAILMIWIYILATIFVIGMGLNLKEESYVAESTKRAKTGKNTQHTKD